MSRVVQRARGDFNKRPKRYSAVPFRLLLNAGVEIGLDGVEGDLIKLNWIKPEGRNENVSSKLYLLLFISQIYFHLYITNSVIFVYLQCTNFVMLQISLRWQISIALLMRHCYYYYYYYYYYFTL